jgi:hypothetical protein
MYAFALFMRDTSGWSGQKATSRNGQSSANYLVLHNHPEQE